MVNPVTNWRRIFWEHLFIKNEKTDKIENQHWQDSKKETHTLKINKLESRPNQKNTKGSLT